MKAFKSIIIITFLCVSNFLLGQNYPDSTQLLNFENLKTEYEQNIAVQWDKVTGSPEIIRFAKPIQFDKNSSKSAEKFINKMKGIIKSRENKDSFVIIETKETDSSKYIKYQQTYQGIPVLGGEYVITVLPNGKVQTALGNFNKDIEIEIKPKISNEAALKYVLESAKEIIVLKDTIKNSKIIVYPSGNKYFLAWELRVPALQNCETWTYYIDANSGEILGKNNDVIYEFTRTPMLPEAQAYVCPRHPGLDGSYAYISPVLRLSMNGYLRGTYAYIYNDEGSEAYNSSNDFRYSTSNAHFDEANLYYHIDRFRYNYFRILGFNSFTQIIAHANHTFSGGPNASYSLSDHHLRFSNGQGVSGYNSFAREDKIIYHEYTHAVTDHVAGLQYAASQSGAIHEGNSDYFAASYTGRTVLGEYSSSGHSINQRNIASPRITDYSEYNDPQSYIYNNINYGLYEPHFGGELWAACLWDLRSTSGIGQYYADRLAFKGLFALPTTATFLQYRQSIIDWDNNYYGGNHVSAIINAFHLRGIGTDNISVYISGPGYLDFKEIGLWSANISGGTSSRTYKWYKSSDGTNWGSVVGTSSTFSTTMLYDDFHLRCIVTDSQTEEEASATKIVYSEILPKQASSDAYQLEVPREYGLSINYPNPFNPSTLIKYQLKEPGLVSLKVYDVLGKEVAELAGNYKNVGYHETTFDAKEFSSGIYFYILKVNDFMETKKMLLTK